MSTDTVQLIPLRDLPEVAPGDGLATLIGDALQRQDLLPLPGDVLAVAQKVVSKAEGRYRDLADVSPGPEAIRLAGATDKDPRLVELILAESRAVVAQRPGVIIVEHRLGYVMANAGIDRSNVPAAAGREPVLLLPEDPDASCAALQAALQARFGTGPACIITDTAGRAWRNGVIGICLGAAGLPALRDQRGRRDREGRELLITQTGFADEIAAAASLLMGQADESCPVVLLRGLSWQEPPCPASALLRDRETDLFR